MKIAIADSSQLVYSDDYRDGWEWGFKGVGCEVKRFDVSPLTKIRTSGYHSSRGWNSHAKMLAQTIVAWNPDLLWCHHGRAASTEPFLSQIQRAGIPTAVYLCDEPYEVGETAKYAPRFTFIFTMDPCTLHIHKNARGMQKNVFYLPPGVNTDRFKLVPYHERSGDTTALFLGNATLTPRSEYLKGVERTIDKTKILFWKVTGKRHDNWIPLDKHAQLYASCLVGLNVHRDPRITEECWLKRVRIKRRNVPQGMVLCDRRPDRWGTGFWNDCNAPAAHVNPRFFEMAACGTCVVSDDDRSELARIFPAAPRARNPTEFLELVLYYLEHLDEAEAIGLACSSLISKRHTYRHRAAEVLVRSGLKASTEINRCSSLGEPKEWLTTQDFDARGVNPSSEQTGLYGPYDRHTGLSLIRSFGRSNKETLEPRVPW